MIKESPQFSGPCYNPTQDQARLNNQLNRIYNLMSDGRWRTLEEISKATGDPQASVSAQLRHLKKPRFGFYFVDKRRRGDGEKGIWEYMLDIHRDAAGMVKNYQEVLVKTPIITDQKGQLIFA